MLYLAAVALSLAVAPHEKFHGVLCNVNFDSCNKDVDVLEAKAHHIKTLKEQHGVLANNDASCSSGFVGSLNNRVYTADVDIPLVGTQSVSMAVQEDNGKSGAVNVKLAGMYAKDCDNVKFSRSGNAIHLDQPLHEACNDDTLKHIDIKSLTLCAKEHEMHATVATPFVDLKVAAKQDEQSMDEYDNVKCTTDFEDCVGDSGEVDVPKAKAMHIKALKDTHGVIANSDKGCTGHVGSLHNTAYEASVHIPMMGTQSISMAVQNEYGDRGLADVTIKGDLYNKECKGVKFHRTGNEIKLVDSLSAACDDHTLDHIQLKTLHLCGTEKEMHAAVSTPFVDLMVVAKQL